MEIIYRQYKEADIEQIKDLLVDLLVDEAKTNEQRLKKPNAEYREKYFAELFKEISEGKGNIIIAEENNKVIGCVVGMIPDLSEADKLEFKRIKEGYVSDLIIQVEYRHKGIGRELLKQIENYFIEQDCTLSKLYVQKANPQAWSLYNSEGYIDKVIKMTKHLK